MKTLTIVIFGGTGDLARKKLGSAVSEYAEKNKNIDIQLVGIGRSEHDNNSYKKLLETAEKKFKFPQNVNVRYYLGNISKEEDFVNFNDYLKEHEYTNIGRIFYLATSPDFFHTIAKQIASLDSNGFTRIMIEKPFGHDAKSSDNLNKKLQEYFDEEQIYRVDHYLAKSTVENILLLRFSNPLFENVWNSNFVSKIKIIVKEDFGVEKRLAYYNNSGAIRDMIQSHLIQTLLFILMDAPKTLDSKDIEKEKIIAAKKIVFDGNVKIGQYEGYAQELAKANINHSKTETLAEIHLKSNSKRWKGTDIILITGKNMNEKEAHITLEYKKEPCLLYCSFDSSPNKLIFRIQPTSDVELTMNTRIPGKDMNLKNVRMTFCNACEFSGNSIESYETILSECIAGNKNMFLCENVLKETWRLTDSIIDKTKSINPIIYKKGSDYKKWNLNK